MVASICLQPVLFPTARGGAGHLPSLDVHGTALPVLLVFRSAAGGIVRYTDVVDPPAIPSQRVSLRFTLITAGRRLAASAP